MFNLFPSSRLSEVIKAMESFAPITFAEKWDNVGLLVEPSTRVNIKTILLTNDLTLNVLDEAQRVEANLIISYHPPIFGSLKRLTMQNWKEQIIIECLERKIAIYSPHTSWDSCPDGVNDWLAGSLPIISKSPALPNLFNPLFGAGRICQAKGNLTLRMAIEMIKNYTGMPDVRVGIATSGSLDSIITHFAVCAGSGASVLKDIKAPIDLFITGEMSHHDCLDAIHKQISVVTLNHSNSERGYLKDFKNILGKLLNNDSISIVVSESDADPLKTY